MIDQPGASLPTMASNGHTEAEPSGLGAFGHHPEPDIDFGVEVEVLIGMAYDVTVGLESQWPFWGRLSRALRLGREGEWFGQPDTEAVLLRLERAVCDGNHQAVLTALQSKTGVSDEGPGLPNQ